MVNENVPGLDPPFSSLVGDIEFSGPEQRDRYVRMVQSTRVCTRWASFVTLESLYLRHAIRTLFRNIGWYNLLGLEYPGYIGPTLEFASSVAVRHRTLYFRLANAQHELTYVQLCSLIGAPSVETGVDTFDPTNARTLFHLQAAAFWSEITDGDAYVPGHAKASMIVHPVLRVAHRILACSVYAREEPTSVSISELQILYAMTHPDYQKPCFGAALCQRLKQYGTRNSGAIACGGIVTLISQHPNIPSINPDLPTIPGSNILQRDQLQQMHMFRDEGEGTFLWLVGRTKTPFLRVTRATRSILYLARPITNTDWRLTRDRIDIEAPADDAPPAVPPPAYVPGPPEGVHPWVYQNITALQQNFHNFQIEQRAYNTRYGGVLDNIWQWAQHQNPDFPPAQNSDSD